MNFWKNSRITLKKENEGRELKILLEKRKKEAMDRGDFLLATGTIFLLAGLIGYLYDNE